MILEHMKRSIAAALCAVMVVSSPVASFGALAAEKVSEGSDVVQENEPENSSEASSSHVVYGWNEESLALHYETGYAPAWEALSSVLPTSVSANTDEGTVDVAIKGWTYNESYDVNKTGTYLIESVIDEKYALGEGVSNYAALVIIEDVNHAVHFTGLDDLIVLPGSNVNVLDGVTASDGDIEYTVGISSITAVDGTGAEVESDSIELGEEEPVLFSVVDGYTYTVNLVALDEFGEVTDAEPAVRMVYVRDIVQPRAPSMQLMSVRLPANPASGTTSIDDFSVEFVAGGSTNSGAYIWNATRSTSGHQFVYMVSYSTSGVGTSEPGALEIRIPLHMIKDRFGNYADTIEMSVPHEDEITDLDLMLGLTEYAYKIEGDEVVFFNVTEISAAVNGYFEVAYSLNDPTFNYTDMGRSDEMRASMAINSLTAEDTDWPFGINTAAKINSTDKRFPTLYSSWQPSFGTAPADADDYFYLVWEVRSIVDDYITQPYSLEFTDIPTSDNGPVEVVGYKLSGQGGYSTNNIISESKSSGYRYDYILTRHPKSVFDPLDAYLIKNNISITLTPIDGLDAPTTVRSNRNFPWERPEFKYPTGHFMTYKRADGAYRNRYGTYLTELGMKAGKYTRYDLQEFSGRGGETIVKDTLDNFDYAVWTVGYPYPWTIADENKADWKEHPEYFGQVPVRYEQIDEGVFLYPDGGTVSTRALTSQDFEIDTLAYQVQIRDADYNPETCAFESKTGTFTASDILNIYTKATDNSNDWLLSATVNLLTGETNIERAAAIAEAPAATLLSGKTRGTITFGDNIVAYKLETSNAHYFSEIDSVPNMHLKNSAYVMETIAELDSIALRNTVKGTVYKTTDGSQIQTWTEADTDYACVTQRDSYLRKTVVSTENNKKYKYFGINWKIAMEETATFGEGTREYVAQSSGKFYDLLPDGMHVDVRTVAVQTEAGYLAENAYTVEVITNYKDSGRDLLIVNAEEEAQYYNLYFTTRIDWNGIKDYGEEIYNPAAYETGNDVIKYGTCDDGGTIEASDKALMTGLDAECTTNRFIYTGQHYDIAALTAATAGLTKHIKESGDPLYVYKTETVPNGEYSYRLRYMNTIRTRAKDLIFYDSLENYKINGETVGGGVLAEEFTSDWHGTLTGIDVSQMVAMGAAPVIYLSSSENLVFLNNDVGNLPNLSDTGVWKKLEDFGDISNAKAIAIDIRKKADGSDFVLAEGQSVIAILQMKAPAGANSTFTRVPVTYNNVYISDTVIDSFDNEIEKYIHHDYTQIEFYVKGDIKIHKTSSKDGSDIKNIQFRLKGTSDYGDEIDCFAKTNKNGLITFTEIPKGTYTLAEYEGIPDFLEDHTELTVQIADDGKVWFTDKDGVRSEITNRQAEITNDPRVHADIPIGKRDNTSTDLPVQDTTFKLSGTSDYGNEIVMVETTDSITGNLTFRDVEKGTYTLEEIQSNPNYINSGRKYTVTVDGDGNVSIDGTAVEAVEEEESYNAKYAVSVYGIGVDTDDKGETMGITFGPALGASYVDSFKSHTPSGTTSSGNEHRCLHNDDWATIIEWNSKDPDVYEDCIETGCTHSVGLDLTKSENFNPDFVFGYTGDGVSVLFNELVSPAGDSNNLRWNGVNTNAGGWGPSRIRAMLNGWDDDDTDGIVTNGTNAVYTGDGTNAVYTGETAADLEDSYSYNNSLLNCFPDELKAAIGKRATKYDSVYNNKTEGNLKTTYDKLWFLSSNEIWTEDLLIAAKSDGRYNHPLESSQYPYFTTRMGMIMTADDFNNNLRGYYINNQTGYGSDSTSIWWLRSSYGYYSNFVLYVSNNGRLNYFSVNNSSGVSPCFTLSRSQAIQDEDLKGPKNENNRFILYNERYHRVSFSKRSSLDSTGLAGATFRLHGMSNYGRAFDETATSGANGTVSFEKVESGVYTLQEIEAPEGYALDTKEYPVIVYRNGEVEIKDFQYDSENSIYYTFNVKKRDKEIVVVKKWVDGMTNEEREMPKITLSTQVPLGAVFYYTVRYHASNADQTGTFSDGSDVHEVRYEAVASEREEPVPLMKVSHSNNIGDDGTQNGYVTKQTTVDTIKIDGAVRLSVELWYNLHREEEEMFLAVYDGSIEPSVSNARNANVSNGKLFGYSGSFTQKPQNGSSTHKTYEVTGDTVQFLLYVISNKRYYGYWAEIKGYDANGRQINSPEPIKIPYIAYSEIGNNTYEKPSSVLPSVTFSGWYTDDRLQNTELIMTGETQDALGRLPTTLFADLDDNNDGIVDAYAKYDIVTLLPGEQFNSILKKLAGESGDVELDNITIKSIRWSNVEPNSTVRTKENIVSTLNSPVPVYAWFDNSDDEGIIYLWSTAERVEINPNASRMFYRLSALQKISALNRCGAENLKQLSEMFYGCTKLEDIDPLTDWNISEVTNTYNLFAGCKSLVDLTPLSSWDTSNVTTMNQMFWNCSSLTNVDGLANWNTEKVTDMSAMFYRCSGLTNLEDIASWNTGNVTNMALMFQNCSGLTNVDGLASWNTGNVTNISSMFNNCNSLMNLDGLAEWNTGNIAYMEKVFSGCSNLANVDGLTSWNTENVKNMFSMFNVCSGLTNVGTLTNWDTGNVTTMNGMFYGCSGLTNVDCLASWNTENVTTMKCMFQSCSGITDFSVIANWDIENVHDMSYMLSGCVGLTDLSSITGLDIRNVTAIEGLFSGCINLKNIDGIANWNTGNVTNMRSMFSDCSGLTNLDSLTNWNTGNVEFMGSMFDNCSSLTNINDLSNWNTGNVTDMNSMFRSCNSLTNIGGLANWNTEKAKDMGSMFYGCSSLANIDSLANWNTENVTEMGSMFYGCSSLTNVDSLASWNTGNVTDMSYMFNNCSALTNVDGLVNWNTGKVTTMYQMFDSCKSLTNVDGLANWNTGKVTTMYCMFIGCSSLTDASGIDSWAYSITNCNNFQSMFFGANSQHPDWSSVYPNGTWTYGTFKKNN